jgi:hypothetical protein
MFRDVRISDLIDANPSLEQQMRDWQTEQHHRGEDPFDWRAFRSVVSFTGGSDPGADPPSEFFWFTPPGGAKKAGAQKVVTNSDGPTARRVNPAPERAGSQTRGE